MASTFSPSLRLELIGDGDQSGIWGQTTNNNLGALLEQSISGVVTIPMIDANYTLSNFNGVTDEARNAVIVMTGTLSTQRNVVPPLVEKVYTFKNATTGGFSIQIIGPSGTGVVIPNGITASVYCDGVNFEPLSTGTSDNFSVGGDLDVGGYLDVSGDLAYTGTLTGGTGVVNLGSGQFYKDADGNVGIGTSSPQGQFDVSSADEIEANFISTSTNAASYVNVRADIYTGLTAYFRAFRGMDSFAGDVHWAVGQFGAPEDTLAFYVNDGLGPSPSERMRIDTDGNVGIGTASPTAKLTIVGGTLLTSDAVEAVPSTYDIGQLAAFINTDSTALDNRVISLGASPAPANDGSGLEASSGYIRSVGNLSLVSGSTEVLRVDVNGDSTFYGDVSASNFGLGFSGQIWNDVTGSRAIGITYTNSRAYPIMVNTSIQDTVANQSHYLLVNGNRVAQAYIGSSINNGVLFLTAIVPPSATYSTTIASGGTILYWNELY